MHQNVGAVLSIGRPMSEDRMGIQDRNRRQRELQREMNEQDRRINDNKAARGEVPSSEIAHKRAAAAPAAGTVPSAVGQAPQTTGANEPAIKISLGAAVDVSRAPSYTRRGVMVAPSAPESPPLIPPHAAEEPAETKE